MTQAKKRNRLNQEKEITGGRGIHGSRAHPCHRFADYAAIVCHACGTRIEEVQQRFSVSAVQFIS